MLVVMTSSGTPEETYVTLDVRSIDTVITSITPIDHLTFDVRLILEVNGSCHQKQWRYIDRKVADEKLMELRTIADVLISRKISGCSTDERFTI